MSLVKKILDHYRKPRVLGLDLLRIVASLSIILHHGNVSRTFGQNWVASLFGDDGYLAVDVFFVLSGWLLTRQVLRMRASFKNPLAFAGRFWTRRWARTLPPYWIVLIGIFILGPWIDRQAIPQPFSIGDLLRHAFFIQTIVPPNSYGVSWSLITEEWFYLLLPFAVFLAFRIRNRRLLIGFGIVALLTPTVIRTLLLTTPTDWVTIRTQPQARFEGLVIGSALAAASVGASWWERQVMARRRWLFAAGLILIGGILVAGTSDSMAYRIFGLLAFNLSLGLLMPLLSQLRWPTVSPAAAVMAIAYLSEMTYPLYLLHTFRIHLGHAAGLMLLISGVVSIATLFIAATVLHLAVERPFLALRDRLDSRRATSTWKEPVVAPPPLAGEGRVGTVPPAPAGEGRVGASITPEVAY